MHLLEDIEKGMASTLTCFNSQKTFFGKCKCPQILIVDDEPFNLFSLDGLLQSLGRYTVDKAYNG